MKEIKDYLHLYLGCEVLCDKATSGSIILNGHLIDSALTVGATITPLLRPLSSMTEEEMQECGNMEYNFSNDPELNTWDYKAFETLLSPEQFAWLLKRRFDLFNLIESGLAIDKTKHL